MHNAVKTSAVLAALAVLGGRALAQAPTTAPPPAHPGLFSKLFHHPAPGTPAGTGTSSHSPLTGSATPLSGGIIGNKKSHVYHLPGDKGALPAAQNRVYFHSAAEAQAAGYHAAGSGAHKAAHPMMHHVPLPGTPTH